MSDPADIKRRAHAVIGVVFCIIVAGELAPLLMGAAVSAPEAPPVYVAVRIALGLGLCVALVLRQGWARFVLIALCFAVAGYTLFHAPAMWQAAGAVALIYIAIFGVGLLTAGLLLLLHPSLRAYIHRADQPYTPADHDTPDP